MKKVWKNNPAGGERVRARSSLRPSYGPAAEWCMETYLPTLSCCSVFITLGENHFHNTIHLSYENIVLLNQKRQMSCKNSILHNVNHQRRERVHRRGGASWPIFRHDGPSDQRRHHLVFVRFVWTGSCLRWRFCEWKLRFNLWWQAGYAIQLCHWHL